jgi:hypothetical protein
MKRKRSIVEANFYHAEAIHATTDCLKLNELDVHEARQEHCGKLCIASQGVCRIVLSFADPKTLRFSEQMLCNKRTLYQRRTGIWIKSKN